MNELEYRGVSKEYNELVDKKLSSGLSEDDTQRMCELAKQLESYEMNMKIEFIFNRIESVWFDLGIGYSRTQYHPSHRHVISVGIGFWTLYIRWGINSTNGKKI